MERLAPGQPYGYDDMHTLYALQDITAASACSGGGAADGVVEEVELAGARAPSVFNVR